MCKAWAAAAAWVSVDIDHAAPLKNLPAFVLWLEQHPDRLCSLQLPLESAYGMPQLPLLQLPPALPSLECLHLQNLKLELPAPQHSTAGDGSVAAADTGSSAGGLVSLLPHLRELKLNRCSVDSLDSILRLTQASSITRLELCYVSLLDIEGDPDTLKLFFMEAVLTVQDYSSYMLQQLPDLQVLKLEHKLLCPAALQQVSAMQHLQELSVEMPEYSFDDAAATLPSTLTRLELTCGKRRPADVEDPDQAFPHFLSGLHELTHLLELDLVGCTVNPGAISNMPWLQDLRLAECKLLHVLQPDGSFTAGPKVLLESLSKLAQLRHLELALPSLADSAKDAPELFAGLTASSYLTCLSLQTEGAQPLPRGAARHIFKGKKMPQLEDLTISNNCPDGAELNSDDDEDWCLDTFDLFYIMTSCRRLMMLHISRVIRAGAALLPFYLLPNSCWHLTIGGLAVDDAAAATLARHCQLRRLWIEYAPRLTDAGLVHLTALDELYDLCVWCCSGLSKELFEDPDDPEVELSSSPEEGSVCEQLKTMCLRSPLLQAGQ